MLASLVFEIFLSVLFALFLDSLSKFLVAMPCIALDSLFSETSFGPYFLIHDLSVEFLIHFYLDFL